MLGRSLFKVPNKRSETMFLNCKFSMTPVLEQEYLMLGIAFGFANYLDNQFFLGWNSKRIMMTKKVLKVMEGETVNEKNEEEIKAAICKIIDDYHQEDNQPIHSHLDKKV